MLINEASDCVDMVVCAGEVDCVEPPPVTIVATRDTRLDTRRDAEVPELDRGVSVVTVSVHDEVVRERIEPYEVPVMLVAYGRK